MESNPSGLVAPVLSLSALVPAFADRARHSPNCDPRPGRVKAIVCIVLHATADNGHEESAESWLTDPRSGVSAHLHIRRDGSVVRLVDDRRRAWHAGRSAWRGLHGVNDFSLGWELANRNDGKEPFTPAQYSSLAWLAAHYVSQGLPLNALVGHADIAIPRGRKTDPDGFDWLALRIEVCRISGVSINDTGGGA